MIISSSLSDLDAAVGGARKEKQRAAKVNNDTDVFDFLNGVNSSSAVTGAAKGDGNHRGSSFSSNSSSKERRRHELNIDKLF